MTSKIVDHTECFCCGSELEYGTHVTLEVHWSPQHVIWRKASGKPVHYNGIEPVMTCNWCYETIMREPSGEPSMEVETQLKCQWKFEIELSGDCEEET